MGDDEPFQSDDFENDNYFRDDDNHFASDDNHCESDDSTHTTTCPPSHPLPARATPASPPLLRLGRYR